ncbi:hypothetical protein MBLNU230_g6646t1 [Neophaeotheca triangularis]
MTTFSMRPARLELSDQELLVDFMDSHIQWLSANGSSGQWGTQPVREARPNITSRAEAWIKKSEEGGEWGSDWCRAFIVEANHNNKNTSSERIKTPVAGLVLTASSADYVRSVLPEQDKAQPFVYLSYVMTNRHAGTLAKGAGAFAIDAAKTQTCDLGFKRLCLDCWAGNERKLVRYYESQGFEAIGDFEDAEDDWPCTVLEMRL